MICPICKSEILENAELCDNCGAILTDNIKENEPVQTEALTEEASAQSDYYQEEALEKAQGEESAEESEETEPSKEATEKTPNVNKENVRVKAQSQRRQAVPNKKAKSKKNSKGTSKYSLMMKIVVLVCVGLMAVLAAVSKTTVIFKNDNSDKTVVLSGLAESEKASFEAFAPKLGTFFKDGFDSSQTVFDDILPLVNPSEKGGLYEAFFGKANTVTETADPVSRFTDGEDGYYAVKGEDVSEIAKTLSLVSLDDANAKDYYYFDGNYYFRFAEPETEAEKYTVKIADSKKTSDGDYYITCDIFKNGEAEAQKQLYFIASFEKNDDTASWKVSKISTEALYSQLGSKLEKTEDDTLPYNMKRKTVEAVTSDGKVYAKYIIEYPSFTGSFMMKEAIENQFKAQIDRFERASKKADERFKGFIEKGGSEEDLPFYTHVVFSVKYNADGYLSMVERNTIYNTDTLAERDEETTSQFPKTTYEGQSFEVQSGDFIKKDDLLGKDYQSTEQVLYKNWFEANNGSQSAEIQIPNDLNSVGHGIYSSAWYITKEDVHFLYQDENGALETVSMKIPDEPEQVSEATEN